MIETGGLDHLGGNITPKIGDLLTDVAKEGIAGPPSQKHDGVDRNVVEVHGHGSRGPTGMETNFFGSDAKTLVINGTDVGPQELQGRGAGDIAELSSAGHVGINEGIRGGLERLKLADNGRGSFDGAKKGVRGGRLGHIVIPDISFLPFKMDSDFLGSLEKG